MSSSGADPITEGVEIIVDAHGCAPERLRSEAALAALFDALVQELSLKPIGAPHFHTFPSPGGVTGMLMLSESHLTVHTFPESSYAALNLYCCRPRAEWPWEQRLFELLGATRVERRSLPRPGPLAAKARTG